MKLTKIHKIILAASVCAILILILVIVCSTSSPAPYNAVELNKSITNEMSSYQELEDLDKHFKKYIKKWHIKGASLAIVRNDSLVYAKGYGWADEEKEKEMHPGNILRMASVSKLITAAGIMVLQDQGKLNIKDKVFGEEAILNSEFYNSLIKDKNYYKITIEHLLRHQGGFSRDPLFSSNDVQKQMRLDHTPTAEDYIELVLSRKLRFIPGKSQKYSNFGYLLLSKIIEQVSGKSYEEFIKEDVLYPAGCYDMHIAGIYYKNRRKNEVRYYTHEGDGKYIEEYNGSGKIVERCYGGSNLTLLQGAGAWCGSPVEIARFVASIDGHPGVQDIISKESHDLMIEYFDAATFSLGWNDTTPSKGWSRSGTLAGTNALVRHYPDGECWIFITNTSTYRGPRQSKYIETLFREARKKYSSKLPKVNLFEQ